MSYWGQMTKTASIQEPGTPTLDDANVATESWGEAADSRCALQPVRGMSAQAAFARTLGADYVMFVPRETSIGPETANGKAWKVMIDSVVYMTVWVEDMAGKARYTKVYLRRAA